MDLHSFAVLDLDPGEQILKIKQEKWKENDYNCNFIQIFQVNLHKLLCFFYFLKIFYVF